MSVENPNITYHFEGEKDSFYCFMKGGNASLHKWAYNYDGKMDTSVFLYAQDGKVRLDSFVLLKSAGRYAVSKPILDFESTPSTVTIKDVMIKDIEDQDVQGRTGEGRL